MNDLLMVSGKQNQVIIPSGFSKPKHNLFGGKNMIIQVSMDIEVEDNYSDSIVEAFANTLERTYDYPVLGACVTASWKDEDHYSRNEQN